MTSGDASPAAMANKIYSYGWVQNPGQIRGEFESDNPAQAIASDFLSESDSDITLSIVPPERTAIRIAASTWTDVVEINRVSKANGAGGTLNADEVSQGGIGSVLVGSDQDDILNGRVGWDFIDGLGGDDVIRGGDGRDIITGGPGADVMHGGYGWNTFTNEQDGYSDLIIIKSDQFLTNPRTGRSGTNPTGKKADILEGLDSIDRIQIKGVNTDDLTFIDNVTAKGVTGIGIYSNGFLEALYIGNDLSTSQLSLMTFGDGSSPSDTTAPVLSMTDDITDSVATGDVTFTFSFSEEVTGFTADDVIVSGGTKGAFSGNDGDSSYTLVISPSPNSVGTITVDIDADVANDAAGNGNIAAAQVKQDFDTQPPDTTAPTVSITDDITDSVATGDVTFTFSFSEEVTGFTANDVIVSGGTKGAFSVNNINSGLRNIDLEYRNGSGGNFGINIDGSGSSAGTAQGQSEFNPFIAAGTWSLYDIGISDEAGNFFSINADDEPDIFNAYVAANNLETNFEVINGSSDSSVPTISNLQLNAATYDLSNPTERIVTATVDFNDQLAAGDGTSSGLRNIDLEYRNRSEGNFGINIDGSGSSAGTAQGQSEFNPFIAAGTWSLYDIGISDEAGNFFSINADDEPDIFNAYVAANNLETNFEVINGSSDSSVPTISNLQLNAATYDLSNPTERIVTATVDFNDQLAAGDGASSGLRNIDLEYRNGSGGNFGINIDGSGLSVGTAQGQSEFNPFIAAGTWSLYDIGISDEAGNFFSINAADQPDNFNAYVAANNLETNFEVINRSSDSSVPTISNLQLNAATYDLSNPTERIVTATVNFDDQPATGDGASSYNLIISPTPDTTGTITVEVNAGVATDKAGNNNIASNQVAQDYDTINEIFLLDHLPSSAYLTTEINYPDPSSNRLEGLFINEYQYDYTFDATGSLDGVFVERSSSYEGSTSTSSYFLDFKFGEQSISIDRYSLDNDDYGNLEYSRSIQFLNNDGQFSLDWELIAFGLDKRLGDDAETNPRLIRKKVFNYIAGSQGYFLLESDSYEKNPYTNRALDGKNLDWNTDNFQDYTVLNDFIFEDTYVEKIDNTAYKTSGFFPQVGPEIYDVIPYSDSFVKTKLIQRELFLGIFRSSYNDLNAIPLLNFVVEDEIYSARYSILDARTSGGGFADWHLRK